MKKSIQISVSKKGLLIISDSYCCNMYELWNRDNINTKFPSNLNNIIEAYYKGIAFTKLSGEDTITEDGMVKNIDNLLNRIKNAHTYSEAQEVYVSPVIYNPVDASGDETPATVLVSRDEKSIYFINPEYAKIFKALQLPIYAHRHLGLVWCGYEEDVEMVVVYAAAVMRQKSLNDPLLRQVVNVMKERIDEEVQNESSSDLA